MAFGCGMLGAAQQGEVVDGEYVMTVASGDVTLNSDDVTALGTSVNLVKKGGGRLIIASDLAGWTGELRIEAGYVQPRHVGAMGYTAESATSGGVVVKSGGTLEIDGNYLPSGGNKTYAQCHRFRLEGTGVGGTAGAVRLLNASSYWCNRINLKLTGDTTFTASSATLQLDVRGGTYDMDGHTVTIDGLRFCVCNATAMNAGNYIVKNAGWCVSEQTNYGTASKGKTISFADGTALRATRVVDGFNWYALDFAGAAALYTQQWSDDILHPRNVLNGPVTLGGTVTVQFQKSSVNLPYASGTEHNTIELKGQVSGAGGFNVTDGWLLLSNATNDFTGATTVNGANAHIIAKDWYALPSVTNGLLSVKNGGSVDRWLNPTNYPSSAQMDGEIADFFRNANSMVQGGSLALDVLGTYTYTTPVSGSFGPLNLAGGTLAFSNCGVLPVDSQTNWVAGTWPDIARVVVDAGAAFDNDVATPISVNANMTINDRRFWILGRTAACAAARMRGILEVKAGGTVTNRIDIGGNATANKIASTAAGALYVRRGGQVVNPYQSNGSSYFGNSGYGYAEVEDGGLWNMGNEWVRFGSETTGRGVFWQKGGTVLQGGLQPTLGYSGGRGVMRLSSGTFTGKRGVMLCCTLWGTDNPAGRAVLTVENDAVVTFEDKCVMAANTDSAAILNLNGGIFRILSFEKATNVWNSLSCYYTTITSMLGAAGCPYTGNRADVNFNGGALRPLYSGCLFGSTDGTQTKPDRVTVYAAGAILDTTNQEATCNMPLQAPSGKGVARVPFTCTTHWNYIGSPVVTIVGDGTGASAFAEFDSTNGTVTGVVVTSPGNDYTTAKAVISGGGWTNTVEVSLADCLADNVTTGGLTKVGSGTLILSAVNTYKGPTVVRSGTLRLGVDHAIDPASALRVESGATANLNGKALAVSGLSGAGSVTGSLTVTNAWHVNAADLVAGRCPSVNGTVTFAAGTTLVVDDPEGLLQLAANQRTYSLVSATALAGERPTLGNLETPWTTVVSGGTLKLGYQKGTLVIFR